ncbi:MAG: DUF3168 domain-containing protein [Actinomycetota bacterium]
MIEEGLHTLLLGDSSVTALVDGAATGELRGVYVDDVPRGARPDYVLVATLEDDHNNTLDGGDGSGAGALFTAEVEIDCCAVRPGDAKALARAVLAVLEDFEGAAGSVTIEAMILGRRQSGTDDPLPGEDHRLHVETLPFTVQYRP